MFSLRLASGGDVLKEGLPVDFCKRRRAGLQHPIELLPSAKHRIVVQDEAHLAERRVRVAAKIGRHFGVAEPSVTPLREHSDIGQRAQQAPERWRGDTRLRGEFCRGFRIITKKVGNSSLHDDA
jgi:hypothetical protein